MRFSTIISLSASIALATLMVDAAPLDVDRRSISVTLEVRVPEAEADCLYKCLQDGSAGRITQAQYYTCTRNCPKAKGAASAPVAASANKVQSKGKASGRN
ncbi:hypothetical protein C8J56DRAFT_902660 [Mycena floridula]|nr:hypothetical protein C8J56DRAFT_902660 [Mycena floridula]